MESPYATPVDRHGVRILLLDAKGPLIASDRDAADVVGEVFSQQAGMVVIPIERLTPDFFVLRTRVAGEMIQKFVNYDIRVAILGDISAHVAASTALGDFVTESNRGAQVWFLADEVALDRKLAAG
jgi:hypothetical protein